jgi:hypothetical protein
VGYQLYRAILAGAPADWSAAERLLALVIADDVSDKTGRSQISVEGRWLRDGRWQDGLVQKTGLTADYISKTLNRLAKKGYEFRVAIGQGKDGRSVYAARGHALDFCVPEMPARPQPQTPVDDTERPDRGADLSGSKAGQECRPIGLKAGQECGAMASKGRTGALPPPPKDLPLKNPPPLYHESHIIRSAFPDATEGEIRAIVKSIKSEGVRSVFGVLRYRIGEGTVRLPCDEGGPGRHGPACSDGYGADSCTWDWCECRCHVKVAGA